MIDMKMKMNMNSILFGLVVITIATCEQLFTGAFHTSTGTCSSSMKHRQHHLPFVVVAASNEATLSATTTTTTTPTTPFVHNFRTRKSTRLSLSSSPSPETESQQQSQQQQEIKLNNVKPRTGIAQTLLNMALSSPLWKLVLVPQARANIVKTAQANGIKWTDSYNWLLKQDGPWNDDKSNNNKVNSNNNSKTNIDYPTFYTKEFHAYEDGNLCWDAAIEQELASRAVGARNFPEYGPDGEDVFRSSFENAYISQGAFVSDHKHDSDVSNDNVVVDLGCGTGTSTRRLATLFPNANKIIGIDLSPYFIDVGNYLLHTQPKGQADNGPWVTTITNDERISLQVGDARNTNLEDDSVDLVNLSLLIHELPIDVTMEIIKESKRILKPNGVGQICISEMDFDSPAYAKQRENALLFSLLRATEPYLDVYADGFTDILNCLVEEFDMVKITAATGRHYALVGTKGSVDDDSKVQDHVLIDSRFDSDGNYIVDDTHLKVWESKEG